MASAVVLQLESLVAPIAGPNPAGSDPRSDLSSQSAYRRIRDARAQARAVERLGLFDEEGESSGGKADWRPVLELAPQILREQAKDLEVVALLIEALIRTHGFAGLRDGFQLARELIERYWDHLYPSVDEEGVATKVAPLAGLNGDGGDGLLIEPIGRVPITEGKTTGPLSLSDYKRAAEVERIEDVDRRARRLQQAGAVSLQAFQTVVTETSPEFVHNLLEDLTQCEEQFRQLCAVLEEKCGTDASGFALAPPSSTIRRALQESREGIEGIYRHLLPTGNGEEAGSSSEASSAAAPPAQVGGAGIDKAVGTREEAFRALLQVADFFKRTEPHSPVSYLLEQAVRWGRMPLPELLSELIAEDSTREQLFKLVGIRSPQEKQP